MSLPLARPSGASDGASSPQGVALKKNALGVLAVAFLVISAAGPLGYLGGFAPLAILVGGVGAPSSYVIGGLALLLFVAGFTAMTPYVAGSGAFYAYIARGLGKPAGAVAAVFALIAYNVALIGALGLLATYINPELQKYFGFSPPWAVTAIGVTVVVFGLASCGIDVGAKLLGVLLVGESALLALLAVKILATGGASGLDVKSFSPSAVTAPGMGAVLALSLVGFLGIEGAALYRAETRNPDRTIPRATYAIVTAMAVFYGFVAWTIVEAFGSGGIVKAANTYGANLFFEAARQYLGSWASDLMQLLIITSLLAAQLAFHNAANRYAYSLSRDGVLPRSLALTRRSGAPWVAGAWQAGLSIVAIAVIRSLGLDPYRQLALWFSGISILLIILLQVMTCAAVIVFFWKRDAPVSVFRRLIAPLGAGIALTVALWQLLRQFNLLTNANHATNVVILSLIATLVVMTVVGVAIARAVNPTVLSKLSEEPVAPTVDDAAEVSAR